MDRRTFIRAAGATAAVPTLLGATSGSGVTEEDYRIESFDGAEIAATLFLPPAEGKGKGANRHHVVLSTHGWGGDRGSVAGYARLAAEHGYVALTWDQRGFGESDGEVGLSGPKEVNDVSALIDWVAEHDRVKTPGGDPRVGMIGASYGGGIQLNAAAVDDRIRAIIPIVPWHDLTFSLAPNGVPKLGWVSLLYGSGVAASRGLQSGDGQPDEGDLQRGVSPRLHEIYAKTMARNELPAEGESFLKVRSPAVKLDRIDAPAMVVQGWPDTLFIPNEGQRIVDGLRANGTEAKLVFFDGGHTATETAEPPEQVAYLEGKALEWFDEHLRGEGESSLAPVTYWDDDEDVFVSADAFPPRRADEVSLSLADGGSDATLVNSGAPTSASQISPQNGDAASGATAANFDFDVTGNVVTTPTLDLSVTPLGQRAFLFAKVKRVRDGEATLVNNQALPVAIEGTPGDAQELSLELVSFQRHFEEGDTLRLTLATTDAGFTSARQAGGVQVDASASTLTLSIDR
jgi:putative CocE/NonD family hydrolase